MLIAHTPQQFEDLCRLMMLAKSFENRAHRTHVLHETLKECGHDVYVVEVHQIELHCDEQYEPKLYVRFMFDADQGNIHDGRVIIECKNEQLTAQLQIAT
jgi:hypothetical protein